MSIFISKNFIFYFSILPYTFPKGAITIGSITTAKAIRAARKDEKVNAIVIRIDDQTKEGITGAWNKGIYKAYDDGCEYFFQCGDDIIFLTKKYLICN